MTRLLAALILSVAVLAIPTLGADAQSFPAPEKLEAQVDVDTVTLTWVEPSEPPPRGWLLAGYRVYRDETQLSEEQATSYIDPGRAPDTYLYAVTAVYRESTFTRDPDEQESSPARIQVMVSEPPPPDDDPPPPPDDEPPPPPDDEPPPPDDEPPPPEDDGPPPSGDGPAEDPSGPEAQDEPATNGQPEEPHNEEGPPDDDAEVEPPPEDPQAGPITFDRHSASPGSAVVVSGDGCPPGDEVVVSVGGARLGTGVADDDGAFAIDTAVGSQPGVHEVAVVCAETTRTGLLTVVLTTNSAGASGSVVATVLVFLVLVGSALWPRHLRGDGQAFSAARRR